MSITDRLSFITRSYLNALRRRGKSVLDETGLGSLGSDAFSDDELEREIRRRVEEDLAREQAEREGTAPEAGAAPPPPRPSARREAGEKPRRETVARRRLTQCYANLELTPSATVDEVHKAWRRLILKYHPDRYPGDAAKQERATRITQIVNESYHTLLTHLGVEKR